MTKWEPKNFKYFNFIRYCRVREPQARVARDINLPGTRDTRDEFIQNKTFFQKEM